MRVRVLQGAESHVLRARNGGTRDGADDARQGGGRARAKGGEERLREEMERTVDAYERREPRAD